ncbi:hypothetical protein PENSPDRAFT_689996 [Peniophora sp. CONT]|nr:hypothetical protein PENSPDRAFT_689996 [Peniophora sp. CONT]
MSDGPVDVLAWQRAHAERCCQLVAACLVVYEHVLQFDKEVEYFWRKRWSVGKVLFFWSRYFTMAFVIGNAAGARFFHWQNTGAALQVITTHLVLEMRLYAMWRNTRVVVCILIGLVVMECTTIGVLFGTPNGYGNTHFLLFVTTVDELTSFGTGLNQAGTGVFICADGDSPGKPWIVFYYTVILITEVTLLTLSIIKAWMHRKTAMKSGLLVVLTKDSVYYFLYLFWVYLLNEVIWVINIASLNELATGFAFSISAVFANRLMISLRETYYKQQEASRVFRPGSNLRFRPGLPASTSFPTTDETSSSGQEVVASYGSDSEDIVVDDIELQTFNERVGF